MKTVVSKCLVAATVLLREETCFEGFGRFRLEPLLAGDALGSSIEFHGIFSNSNCSAICPLMWSLLYYKWRSTPVHACAFNRIVLDAQP